jgi:hypothetical protein
MKHSVRSYLWVFRSTEVPCDQATYGICLNSYSVAAPVKKARYWTPDEHRRTRTSNQTVMSGKPSPEKPEESDD